MTGGYQEAKPKELIQRVVERYKQGEDTRSIADSEGVSLAWISKWLALENVPLRVGGWVLKPEAMKRVIDRYMQGESMDHIADMENVTRLTIQKWIKRAGVPPRPLYHRANRSIPIRGCKNIGVLGYAAGMIDGEGSLYCQSTIKNRRHYVIRVYNTDRRCLDFLQKSFGGWVFWRHRGHQHWKNEYSWLVSNLVDVSRLLEQIVPFLVIKRSRANEALEYSRQTLGDYYEPLVLKPIGMVSEIETLQRTVE